MACGKTVKRKLSSSPSNILGKRPVPLFERFPHFRKYLLDAIRKDLRLMFWLFFVSYDRTVPFTMPAHWNPKDRQTGPMSGLPFHSIVHQVHYLTTKANHFAHFSTVRKPLLTPVNLLSSLLNLLVSLHHQPCNLLKLAQSEISLMLQENPWWYHRFEYNQISNCLTREVLLRYLEERLPYDSKLFNFAIRCKFHDVVALFVQIYPNRVNLSENRIQEILKGPARFVLQPFVTVEPPKRGNEKFAIVKNRLLDKAK